MTEAQKKVKENNDRLWNNHALHLMKKDYIRRGLIEQRYEGNKYLTELYVRGNYFATLINMDKGYVNDMLWLAAMRTANFMGKAS